MSGSVGGGSHGGGGGGSGGDLFADLYILLRDLDPSGGGGNGEPVLDGNGQTIPVGLDTTTGETFPIYYTEVAEGDFEIPADQVPYLQEVVLERVNVIRAPDSVREHALEEALGKITAATSITTDFAGRIVADGATIDAPNENLALYHLILTEGGVNGWTDVLANAGTNLPSQITTLLASGWDPTGLLGGAAGKETPFTMDAVLTTHSISGVNDVTGSGDTLQINYFSFTDGTTETFDYDRVARYGDTWVQWFQDLDGDPFTLEAVQRTLLDAVWGTDGNGDGVNDIGSGVGWTDEYIKLSADGLSFETFAATGAGINDWSAAVDDSRAVINFMHEAVGGATVTAAPQPIVATGDFNGDGTDDIALRNPDTGIMVNWQMADSAVDEQLVLGNAAADWDVTGAGDFNGDGTEDILFRNTDSGWVLNWQLTDGTASASVAVAGAGADWNIVGVGDFNGDGTDDIMLRHETSGWLLDWTMTDGTRSAEDFVAGAGLDWNVIGTGDFNGDGTTDILLRHQTSGWLLNWTMSNGAVATETFVGGAGLDWQVTGIGDFNGDGTDDILLRHDSGVILDWEMANGTLSREVSVANAGENWAVTGTGDYNGDGTDDVLFQNDGPYLPGVVRVWEMADGVLGTTVAVASPSPDLTLVA